MNKTYLFILAFLFVSACTMANEVALKGAEVGKWTMDIDAAYKLAEEKQLPIVINFTGSDWCYWCKLMDKNVFAKEDWKKYAKDKLILVTIDFPSNQSIVPEEYKKRNKEIAEEFEIQGYPTYVVLNHKKEVLAELGAGKQKTPKSFQREVDAVVHLSPDGIETTLAKLTDKEKSAYKKLIEERQAKIGVLEAWFKTSPEETPENVAKYESFVKEIEAVEEKLSLYW